MASINNLVAISVFRFLVIQYAHVRGGEGGLIAGHNEIISEQLLPLQQEGCYRPDISLLELQPGPGPAPSPGLGPLRH